MSSSQRMKMGAKNPRNKTGDEQPVAHSVPADFGSRIHPPPTPALRPSLPPDSESKMPELVMPGTSPQALGILDRSTEQGSFSLKDDRSPLATISASMPARTGFHGGPLGGDVDDNIDPIVGSLKILTIIDEEGPVDNDKIPGDDGDAQVDMENEGDDDPMFEMED